MTKKQKENLTKKYMVKLNPISDYQKEWMRKNSAKWIFVEKDETAYCDACQTKIQIGKTKHKQTYVCPNCKRELLVLHKHRMSKYLEDIAWYVVPKALDTNTVILRYVNVYRDATKTDIRELARLVIPIGNKSKHTFELIGGEWKYYKSYYFRESTMYMPNKWCCRGAEEYKPTFWRELRKLSAFKYFPEAKELYKNRYYIDINIDILGRNAKLYEKLYKVNMGDFVKADWEKYFSYMFREAVVPNNKETSLIKMLGLNRNTFELFKKHTTHSALKLLKLYPNMDRELLELLIANKIDKYNYEELIKTGVNAKKVIRYIANRCKLTEWLYYTDSLKKMNYPLDDYYMFPKDFYKADRKLANEIGKKENAETNEKMTLVANALRESKELKDMFAGSMGLQVIVPESVEELKYEGRMLHNCLGGYGDRIANKKTLVFFVRQMENPTAPYVALEYNHGRIVQCRLDHNETVKDEKIIQFTELLAMKLRKENILAA